MQQLSDRIRLRHYSLRTERTYSHWVRRYIVFNSMRHPAQMGAPEVTGFLSALATERNVAAATQNQALSAILFLYKEVLGIELPMARRSAPCEEAAAASNRADPG